MRVLIVSQYYPPEPVSKPAVLARGLVARGHSVKVLTGFPNYPTGEIYSGYRQGWLSREDDEGVDVRRVPLVPNHSANPIGRAFNYLSFAATSTTALSVARGADVIYVYATQMTPAIGPRMWRAIGGPPYVLHVQDLWPESITASSVLSSRFSRRIIRSAMNPWLRSTYANSAAVIAIAPTMLNMLIDRGAPADRTHMVYNFADEIDGLHLDLVPDDRTSEGTTNVLYAGNIGTLQNLEVAIHAAARVKDLGLHLTLIGDGADLPKVRELIGSPQFDNVRLMPRVPRREIGAEYRKADFALVSLKNLPIFSGTIPSKFQAALSYGVPVITSVPGDVKSLVDRYEIGFAAEPDSVDALAEAFRSAVMLSVAEKQAMAKRAAETYVREFSQDVVIGQIERILRDASQAARRCRDDDLSH